MYNTITLEYCVFDTFNSFSHVAYTVLNVFGFTRSGVEKVDSI